MFQQKKFLYCFFSFLVSLFWLSCKPKGEKRYSEIKVSDNSRLIMKMGERALDVEIACTTTVDARIEQFKILADRMADYCQRYKNDWPIQCEQGCPLLHSEEKGIYVNLELSVRTDFSESMSSSSSFMLEFTPPTQVNNHTLQCQESALSEMSKFMYTLIFDTVCDDEIAIKKEQNRVKRIDTEIVQTAAALGGDIKINRDEVNGRCPVSLVKKIYKEFESGIEGYHDQLFEKRKTSCAPGTFENLAVGIFQSNPPASKIFAYGNKGNGDWDFLVRDGALKSLVSALSGKTKAKVSYYGMCYPMRVHPARKALGNWMLNNWAELAKEAGCNPHLPPPEILTVGY